MLTLLTLSTIGACFAFAALLSAVRRRDGRAMQLMGLLFVTMLATMLGQLYPAFELLFGAVAIAAAIAYAVPSLFNVRSIVDWRRQR